MSTTRIAVPHQPQACGSFSSASTIKFEMIVAKTQGNCSPVYTYTNHRLPSIISSVSSNVPGFKIHHVCVFSGAVPSEQRAVMQRGRALAEKQAADAARRGNAATRRRKALSVEVEGVRRERIYFTCRPQILLCHYLFPDSWKDLHFQFFLCGFCSFSQLSVFSSYNFVFLSVFSCLCFRLFLFL